LTAGTDGSIGDRPAQLVFGLLVLACFAAFFVTQRLKHTPTAVQQFKLTPSFSPTRPGHIRQERISFKLATADEVTVAILNSNGDVVATVPSPAINHSPCVGTAASARRGGTPYSTGRRVIRSWCRKLRAGSPPPANTRCGSA
jgi:hypothetical protein